MKYCLICGEKIDRPFAATVEHFRPIDLGQWPYVIGNFRTFGLWSGLHANVTLLSPVINTILHWKHRKSRLEVAA